MLNLATSENKTIFRVTRNAWVYYLSVAPDEKSLVMAYAPPSEPNTEPVTSLYTLPLEDGGEPQLLLDPNLSSDRYIQVEWSPDGKYIYFVHYNLQQQPANETVPHFNIFRMSYPDGSPEKIIDHGFWPRLSADSSKLVYISLDPVSGVNELFVANADGSDAHEIPLSDPVASQILDAPIFSPDGTAILFSAPTPAAAYEPNWLDRVIGVQIAQAHNVSSDWWSVPIAGGTVTRLTHLQTIKLFASISPDKKHIASESGEGIFVMDPDGSNLTQLLLEPTISSPLNWIP